MFEFEWLFGPVLEISNKFISDIIIDMLDMGFDLIVSFIKTPSDINAYIPVGTFIPYIQAIAGGLLVLRVVWEVFGQLSGNMPETEGRSIAGLAMQILWSAILIAFLPMLVTDYLFRINNYLMEFINSITNESMSIDIITSYIVNTTSIFILVLALIWGIGFLLLAIAGAIRYIELIIAIMLAPFAALSVVRGNGALITWSADTTAIVFTQALHLFLLQVLFLIMTGPAGYLMKFLLSFAVMSVVLRGPQILRKYIYSSGTGVKVMPVVGGVGRMAASVIRK